MTPLNGRTARMLRVASVLVPLSLILSTVAAVGGYLTSRDVQDQNDRLEEVVATLEAETVARQREGCESGDETRTLIRVVSKGGDLAVGESLIEVFPEADPALVEQLRQALDRRLTDNVNQLPGRRWDSESQRCVDVELDQ